jgi:hypothetical protein
MKWKRRVPATLTGLLALAACTDFAHAQSDPTAVEFPMIGIGFDQTVQVNVLQHPPQPCKVLVTVYTDEGEVLVAFEQGDPDKPLQFGKVVSFFPQRIEVRPEVTLTPPAGVSASACHAQATVEVFDNFSRSAWVLAQGLQPQPPPFMPIYLGPVGLIFEQTARLNVVAFPSGPCKGSIGFIDPSGSAIIEPMEVDLAAGQATFLDLTGLAAGTALGSRRPEVIGVFAPSAPTAPGVCIPSVEIFDRVTGYTRVFIPPGPQTTPTPAP